MSHPTGTLPFDRPDAMESPLAYAELRDTSPVAKVTTSEDVPAWLVTSYDAAGPHHCLGAALARLEVSAALHALSARLPGLELVRPVRDVPWVHGLVDVGPAELPVRW